MSIKRQYNPLTVEHFHPVGKETCQETMAESEIEYSIDMGSFTLHHGTRYGAPIVIAEHHDQQANELSGIWYDDGK